MLKTATGIPFCLSSTGTAITFLTSPLNFNLAASFSSATSLPWSSQIAPLEKAYPRVKTKMILTCPATPKVLFILIELMPNCPNWCIWSPPSPVILKLYNISMSWLCINKTTLNSCGQRQRYLLVGLSSSRKHRSGLLSHGDEVLVVALV